MVVPLFMLEGTSPGSRGQGRKELEILLENFIAEMSIKMLNSITYQLAFQKILQGAAAKIGKFQKMCNFIKNSAVRRTIAMKFSHSKI